MTETIDYGDEELVPLIQSDETFTFDDDPSGADGFHTGTAEELDDLSGSGSSDDAFSFFSSSSDDDPDFGDLDFSNTDFDADDLDASFGEDSYDESDFGDIDFSTDDGFDE